MNQNDSSRSYNSPHRERLAQQTRAEILAGVARVMEADGSEDISFAAVARSAEVSERTIYRHFASKEELLAAFWLWINEEIGMRRYPQNPSELRELLPVVFGGFERREALIRGYLSSRSGEALQRQIIPERRRKISACLSEATSGLSASEARNLRAVVQLLFSSRAWLSMHDNWGMDAEQASAAAQWAVDTLLKEARRLQRQRADATAAASAPLASAAGKPRGRRADSRSK